MGRGVGGSGMLHEYGRGVERKSNCIALVPVPKRSKAEALSRPQNGLTYPSQSSGGRLSTLRGAGCRRVREGL